MNNENTGKILEIKNLFLKYHTPMGETLAIKDLNLDIYKEEFITIVGPSGCGKSTLLSLISGLLKPSSGKIKMNVIILTTFSADFSLKRLLRIKYKSCPPSSDITGSILKNPTDRLTAANGNKTS